jgi:hypothetical protein
VAVVFRSFLRQRYHFHHSLHRVFGNYLVLILKLFTLCLYSLALLSIVIGFTYRNCGCLVLLVLALLILPLNHHVVVSTEFVSRVEIAFSSLFLGVCRLRSWRALVIWVYLNRVFHWWLNRLIVNGLLCRLLVQGCFNLWWLETKSIYLVLHYALEVVVSVIGRVRHVIGKLLADHYRLVLNVVSWDIWTVNLCVANSLITSSYDISFWVFMILTLFMPFAYKALTVQRILKLLILDWFSILLCFVTFGGCFYKWLPLNPRSDLNTIQQQSFIKTPTKGNET